eukprot:Awhi_evm1s2986
MPSKFLKNAKVWVYARIFDDDGPEDDRWSTHNGLHPDSKVYGTVLAKRKHFCQVHIHHDGTKEDIDLVHLHLVQNNNRSFMGLNRKRIRKSQTKENGSNPSSVSVVVAENGGSDSECRTDGRIEERSVSDRSSILPSSSESSDDGEGDGEAIDISGGNSEDDENYEGDYDWTLNGDFVDGR